jgi:hypothetical protein
LSSRDCIALPFYAEKQTKNKKKTKQKQTNKQTNKTKTAASIYDIKSTK